MSAAAGEPATVAVMTAMRERRWLFGLGGGAPVWQTLPRDHGFHLFEERFLASPHRMVVVLPQFANFSAQYTQTFVYLPLAAFERRRSDAAEREFLRTCIERIRPAHATSGATAEVLQLDGSFVAEATSGVGIEWKAPFDVVAKSARVVSKRAALDAIVPALRRRIGPEEGGVYTPHGGNGIFHLLSM